MLFDVDALHALNDRYGTEKVDRLLARSPWRRRVRLEPARRRAGRVIRDVERIRARFGEETAGATLSVGICDGRTLRRASIRLSLLQPAQDALEEAKNQRPAGLSFFRVG